MQPYINPNYFSQPYPNPNPYYERNMGNFNQNYGQPIPSISGRIVDDFSQITANDVPMDNIGAFFIKRDGSELQHRVWGPSGNISTTLYLPQISNKNKNTVILSPEETKLKFDALDELLNCISVKVDGIYDKMDDFFAKQKPARQKKEVDE